MLLGHRRHPRRRRGLRFRRCRAASSNIIVTSGVCGGCRRIRCLVVGVDRSQYRLSHANAAVIRCHPAAQTRFRGGQRQRLRRSTRSPVRLPGKRSRALQNRCCEYIVYATSSRRYLGISQHRLVSAYSCIVIIEREPTVFISGPLCSKETRPQIVDPAILTTIGVRREGRCRRAVKVQIKRKHATVQDTYIVTVDGELRGRSVFAGRALAFRSEHEGTRSRFSIGLAEFSDPHC